MGSNILEYSGYDCNNSRGCWWARKLENGRIVEELERSTLPALRLAIEAYWVEYPDSE